MKKLVCVFVVLCLIFCTVRVFAEDASTMTDEELIEAYHKLVQEIANRQMEKTAHMKPGRYVGGKDIPVGGYLIVIDNTKGKQELFVKISLLKDRYSAVTGYVKVGETFQTYAEINERDAITIEGPFDLISRPRGLIEFE